MGKNAIGAGATVATASTMPAPIAVLFDLDDTLIAFDAVSEQAWQQVIATHAVRTNVNATALRSAINEHSTWYWSDPERHRIGRHSLPQTRRTLVQQALQKLGHDDAAVAHAIADDYTALRTELIHLLPGTEALLTGLQQRGVRMGLVTNGTTEEQRHKIERFALAPYFEFIQVEGELGVGKPEDAAYQHALARLDLPPEAVWFVGDNLEWDVLAPQRHGMTGVWVDRKRQGHAAAIGHHPPGPRHDIPRHQIEHTHQLPVLFLPTV